EYEIGKPKYKVKEIGNSERTGTEITFLPDATIFRTTEYKYETIAARLRELAFLNRGIRLTLLDKREKDEKGNHPQEVFFSEGGLKEFVQFLDGTRESLIPEPIMAEGDRDNIRVEVALQ